MPRKKKVVEGNFENTEAVAEQATHELDMNPPIEEGPAPVAKMHVKELIEYSKDATPDEIRKFLVDHKLIYRDYVPYSELYRVAGNIIQETCYDENGVFVVNTSLVNIYCKVHQFILYVDMDYDGISFSNLYDALREYQIDRALEDYLRGIVKNPEYSWDDVHENIYNVVDDRLDDLKYNEYSVEASMRKIASSVASIIDMLNNGTSEAMHSPELAKAIAEELKKNIKE